MALNQSSLSQRIVSGLEALGFKQGDHAQFKPLADAIAAAVVSEIQANAEVPVTSGSSAGVYKVT
ncbi:MAG: hypothetical protein ACRCSE_05705 [Vibrio sp.]